MFDPCCKYISLVPIGGDADIITPEANVMVVVSVCPWKADVGVMDATCAKVKLYTSRKKELTIIFFIGDFSGN